MALKDQINTVVGGASALYGAGSKGTPIDPENIKHLYMMPVDEMFSAEINRTLVRDLQKQGKLIPLLDAYDVTFSPEENQRSTAPNSGKTSKTRAGLYALTAMFDKGINFQKVLESMEGSNRWRVIVIDDEDQMFGTTGRNDEFKGWQVSNFEVMPYAFKQGSEGGKTSVYMQLGRSSEINKDIGYITTEFLDFLPGDMDGVNQTRLDLSGLVAAATGATFSVKAVIDKDNSTFVDGLTLTSFLIKKNGVTVTPTAIASNAEAKTYTFTVGALAIDEVVEVKLYDSANNRSVIEVGTAPDEVLYQSKEVTGVVTA